MDAYIRKMAKIKRDTKMNYLEKEKMMGILQKKPYTSTPLSEKTQNALKKMHSL